MVLVGIPRIKGGLSSFPSFSGSQCLQCLRYLAGSLLPVRCVTTFPGFSGSRYFKVSGGILLFMGSSVQRRQFSAGIPRFGPVQRRQFSAGILRFGSDFELYRNFSDSEYPRLAVGISIAMGGMSFQGYGNLM